MNRPKSYPLPLSVPHVSVSPTLCMFTEFCNVFRNPYFMHLGNNGFAFALAGIKPLHFAQAERQSKDMILLALPANIHHLRRVTWQALFSLPKQTSSVKEQKLRRSWHVLPADRQKLPSSLWRGREGCSVPQAAALLWSGVAGAKIKTLAHNYYLF